MKKIALLVAFVVMAQATWAQQDPMFTKYMFNTLNYNPGYAGTANAGGQEAMDIVLLHRQQWVGFGDGAPTTQNFAIHSPIANKNIGLGLNTSIDQVGVSRQFNVYGSFAYHINLGGGLANPGNKRFNKLSIGIQGGVSNWTADWEKLNLENPNDPAFQTQQPNRWLPNFGVGVYYYSNRWFAGISAPMLLTTEFRVRKDSEVDLPVAQQYRHYYMTGGVAIDLLSDVIIFRPSFLLKNVGLFMEKNKRNDVGAPTEADIDLAFLFNRMVWVGASFRTALEGESSYDSVDFWTAVRLKNGLTIGAAYDYPLNEIQGSSAGSYEVMLRYDFLRRNVTGYDHVRYF